MVVSFSTVLHQWSVASQQRARRNAMVATTALTRRRIERDEVHDFLAARHGVVVPSLQPVARVTRLASNA